VSIPNVTKRTPPELLDREQAGRGKNMETKSQKRTLEMDAFMLSSLALTQKKKQTALKPEVES